MDEFLKQRILYSHWRGFACLLAGPGHFIRTTIVLKTCKRPDRDMSEKHLKAGDVLPPYNGKLRLFAMRFCPYAERSVLVLNAKNLQYDLVFINLDQKPEWIFDYSPRGTVPALEYEQGKSIFDSNIINVYLDEKYPENPLQSTDPLRRAQDKMIVENFGAAQSAYYTAAFNSQDLQPSHQENFHKGLKSILLVRGTKFLHGDQPGLVDYTLWPFLERFLALPLLGKTEFAMDKSKYERLLGYIEDMKVTPAVKAYYLAPETHAKFTESRAKGDPDYNMLDTSAVCCMRPRKKKEQA
ncbi:pyrimidodiazepine synthase [Phthorimaea operculella]|nr:pyrimidodiazepine synthase [Phthorimaea operculella]